MAAIPHSVGLAEGSIDPLAAKQAAQWLVLLHAGEMSDADRLACEQWRASHPDHERAWQRAELVARKFGMVPSHIGLPALRKAEVINRRTAIKTLALLVTAGPMAWSVYRIAPWQQWTSDMQTAIGEQRQLTLADGTRLTLNTASAVDVRYDGMTRRLILRRGEIMIETARDPAPVARPFIVESEQGSMRALGTRFIVRQTDQTSRIAVTEGAIEVTPKDNSAARFVVQAGQQADFDRHDGQLSEIAPHADAWATGVLYAEKMQLGQFVEEIARYRRGILRCDPAIAQMQVSGAFQLQDTDAVIKALVDSLPIRVDFVTRYWATIGPI
ncbi:MAG: FecR family protein [Oxalicibacterium faecigallinarum]|uniref:FecR family protein n=1 Tax=Oxalicibacterium faecigallinarum TaxID=573741 RepID=UPI00280793ED|nr:FecR family protein [Oxalicibacterium faecigallinarum]MDQ7968898.1 FecR family protein [Oxalicibacterium faecigallinarum]